MGEQTEILDINELASWLKLKPGSIYEMSRRRARVRHLHPLPVLRIGRHLRFNKSEVQTWLERLQAAPSTLHLKETK